MFGDKVAHQVVGPKRLEHFVIVFCRQETRDKRQETFHWNDVVRHVK